MENYYRLEFPLSNSNDQEILISKLEDWPFEGYEEQKDKVLAFIPVSGFDNDLEIFLNELMIEYDWVKIDKEIIEPVNWNQEWENNYEPVIVDDFCAVRATFHAPISKVQYEIIITPKMSFGTGHHATTYMMIDAMESIDFSNKRVLDYGCGTSVLAILASKLGASSIEAVDNDEWAYENSKENVIINNIKNVNLTHGDLSAVENEFNYHVILANINRHIILDTMDEMSVKLEENGFLLCSGFLQEDVEMIIEEAKNHELVFVEKNERESWRCLLFKKV
jgi:ribosomal protein L11 methyltransferase